MCQEVWFSKKGFTKDLRMSLPLLVLIEKTLHRMEIHWLSSKNIFHVQWSEKKVMLTLFCVKEGSISTDFLQKGAAGKSAF